MLLAALTRYQYLCISITIIPDEIIQKYNLLPLVRNSFIYFDICKGMYGLPQARRISNDLLTEQLNPKGYFQCTHTLVVWRHKWYPILFFLVVDNFSDKYVGKEYSETLITAIRQLYPVSEGWTESLYCGITLKWYCQK